MTIMMVFMIMIMITIMTVMVHGDGNVDGVDEEMTSAEPVKPKEAQLDAPAGSRKRRVRVALLLSHSCLFT